MQWQLKTTLIFILTIACRADDKAPQTIADAATTKQLQQMAAVVDELRNEVARLRRLVAQYEFERHREVAGKLGAELAQVRSEQAMLEEMERGRQQDVDDLDKLLGGAEVNSAQRADLASTRTEMALQRAQEIAQLKDAARIREGELIRRLQAEEQTIKNIDEVWRLMKGDTK